MAEIRRDGAIPNCMSQLEHLCQNLDLAKTLNQYLAALHAQNDYYPKGSTHENLVLADLEEFRLSILCQDPEPAESKPALHSYVTDLVFCPLLPGAGYTLYAQNKTNHTDLLKPEFSLEKMGDYPLRVGQSFHVKRFRQVLSIDRSEAFIALVLTFKTGKLSHYWEYDPDSLQPSRIILSNIEVARLETTTKILAEIGDARSTPFLQNLCTHKMHTVRWGAVQALINIDYAAGVKVLQNMKTDPHTEIQSAAATSLKMLNA